MLDLRHSLSPFPYMRCIAQVLQHVDFHPTWRTFIKVERLLATQPNAALSRTVLPFLKIALTSVQSLFPWRITAHSVPRAPWLLSISVAARCSPVRMWDTQEPWSANISNQLKGDFHTANVKKRSLFLLSWLNTDHGLNMKNTHNMQSFFWEKRIVWKYEKL